MKRALLVAVLGLIATAFIISLTVGEHIIQGTPPSLASFAVISFFGYLFFLIMPVEILVPIYLNVGFSPWAIFLLGVGVAMPALVIDYYLGRLIPDEWIEKYVGDKRNKKYRGYLEKWGKYVILFFAATPLSSPILTFVAGAVRFPFWQLMRYTIIGFCFKYAVLILLSSFL